MNWKTLGNAILVTTVLTAILVVLLLLGSRFPWLIGVVVFVLAVALIYIDMCKYDELDDDDAKEDEK